MDVDIDLADRNDVLSITSFRSATLIDGKKHNTGVYFTEIPHNPLTNNATIDYKEANERGYFKIDLLNVSVYKNVRDEEHLIKLMEEEPLWELLDHKEFVDQLFHLSGHHELITKLKPRTVEQLAAALAIIRPGKRYLANENWEKIMKEVWISPSNPNTYYFKKSHATAYSMTVVVHMNLIREELSTLAS